MQRIRILYCLWNRKNRTKTTETGTVIQKNREIIAQSEAVKTGKPEIFALFQAVISVKPYFFARHGLQQSAQAAGFFKPGGA